LIDTLRKQIQERLDELLGEAEKLRHALAALEPRGGSSAPAPAQRSPTRARSTQPTATPRPRTRRRTAPGATKARVLAALAGDQARTAGEVAAATGLPRGTVSTTLSKLAKSGEVLKAEHGYRLP
jgi:sugar-specific transcriptional regulator TrmB